MRVNPVACSSFSAPGLVSRRVFCSHYETCLDHAVKMDWNSFSCGQCRAYAKEKRAPEEWAKEAEKCLLLMQLVAFEGVGHKVSRRDSYVIKKRVHEMIHPCVC